MANEFRLIAVGKLKAGAEAELFARYNERLRPRLAVTEIAEARGNPAEIKRREAEQLLAALPLRARLIALDLGGPIETSEKFAARYEIWRDQPEPLCFMIGGAEGLDQTVLARSNHLISLGRLTWPHMLVRVLLAEQLFRAQSILGGHPYHRGGRPGGDLGI